ncbi:MULTISPECIES: UDP-N-acetylmuramoylalanyl-D-glutamyl-2,6-diaminopimelate--D-alanyl-D-alanine ligase [unclassified Aureimonas]|uniref:UDP-N-acetylmuramoylalanyl-D-glutamyl-2, 6-diaminopimelate--D-alanyl-D-alanine ligase n=1 Tax=unclassified Aureimonas TaxID=2615206 RepID=UPI0006FAA5AA|nr:MULTISPECIES: UDP-N-acetylmuramoylalanyl-D-glutamyl-2,6-diaminopimelate--D-alanyl-D-alanine ligase [unclassified Aureimonas]KQT52831.1 UDP-N-acetylmuramoylalanyl-D-glutamyl-2, 6-diaminopimelate--D-alanyl-D-alanine ligase [Aureimonas sp. Leaf427]KQT80291.1 UDP-N-acetylmuramoylalanyl-D-glutamyl-2, 6-diaminopimelate--D-alanyl-D-alanine ligase [Aureimonas sp. Leaf460]
MTDYLWDIDALVAATGGRAIGTMPRGVTGLSIDTRTVTPGDAFFAIKGDRFDGHTFLTAAVAAGASVLVVSEKKLPALGRVHGQFIVVEDVLTALVRLSTAARARSKAKIVAVTGSVGKTTTKEALRHGLSAAGKVHASAASFNNHWGVPLSLARMPADARFGIFEIGMNHPDEIRPLVKIVRPHVAIVTLIAPAHLGHFNDIGEIAKAKGEVFEGLVMGGTAVVNADDPQGPALIEMARAAGVDDIKIFGEGEGAEYRLLDFQPMPDGARMRARIGETEVALELAASGRHIADNLLAVLGTAQLVGADVETVAAALSSWRAGKGRGERHRLPLGEGELTLIDESYNANPASMRAAIAVLAAAAPSSGGRRIAILGDMLELGEQSGDLHAELGPVLVEAGVDRVYLLGNEMKALDDALDGTLPAEWHESLDELQASLLGHLRAGDVVMVKGSNGIGLSRIVDRLIAAHGSGVPGSANGAGSTATQTGTV